MQERKIDWKGVRCQPLNYVLGDNGEIREEAVKAYTYIPEDIELPEVGHNPEQSLEALQNQPLPIKLFLVGTQWTWYIAEFTNNQQGLIFCYCVSGLDPNFSEWGFNTLEQLIEQKGFGGLPIERDIHYTPKTWNELKEAGELDW